MWLLYLLISYGGATCNPYLTTCGDAVREIPKELSCLGFVGVHGCSGLLNSKKLTGRRGCDEDVVAGVAGYCLCDGPCEDTPEYKDVAGFQCSQWQGHDCRRIVRDHRDLGYKQWHQDDIIENCAKSCNICDGIKIRHESCDHDTFRCANECKRANTFGCVKFRSTLGCNPDSELDPAKDKHCYQYIEDKSGYCECTGGRTIKVDTCKRPGVMRPFTCAELCRKGPTPYELLGIGTFAEFKEYKKAFRGMSLRYHPDKTINKPTEQAQFEAIRHAYDVVQDSSLKDAFDFGGWELLKRVSNNYDKPSVTDEIKIDIRVPLKTMYLGGEVTPNFKRILVCHGCRGESTSRCRKCKDECIKFKKYKDVQQGNMIYREEYFEASEDKCRKETLDTPIMIEKGVSNGHEVHLHGQAHQATDHIAGELIFKLQVDSHPTLKRLGNNLVTTLSIGLKEALTGVNRTIEHLDGHTVTLEVDSVSAPFTRVRIVGEGMPIYGSVGYGDLVVELKVEFPTKPLNREQKDWILQNLSD